MHFSRRFSCGSQINTSCHHPPAGLLLLLLLHVFYPSHFRWARWCTFCVFAIGLPIELIILVLHGVNPCKDIGTLVFNPTARLANLANQHQSDANPSQFVEESNESLSGEWMKISANCITSHGLNWTVERGASSSAEQNDDDDFIICIFICEMPCRCQCNTYRGVCTQ